MVKTNWIKMRSSLLNHPKVIIMVNHLATDDDFLNFVCDNVTVTLVTESLQQRNVTVTDIVTRSALRYITVAGLLALWSSARSFSDGGVIEGISITDLDEMAGVPGIGKALQKAGWAIYDDERKCVVLKDFEEWNDQEYKAKTNAERQRDYRIRKKELETVTDVTKSNAEKSREDKSREEKNKERKTTTTLEESDYEISAGKKISPESILQPFPEKSHQPALQAAIAYQTRRYGSPNPSASWYGDLLREAATVFEVADNPEAALELFQSVARRPVSKELPRNATFSDLCLAAGIKQAKAPPWKAAESSNGDESKRKLLDSLKQIEQRKVAN